MVLKPSDFGNEILKSPAERWADMIRVKDEFIKWPFTRDTVKGAVRYFGEHHRPLLPYLLREEEYDEIVIAEDIGNGYRFYDSDISVNMPEVGTYRELAEWEGEDIETFAANWGLDDDQLDEPLGDGVIQEHVSYDVTPEGRSFDLFQDLFYPPASYEFPVGMIGMDCGNGPHAWIQPKVALTFLQIYLDYEETGIKIVLEDEWLKQQRARNEEE